MIEGVFLLIMGTLTLAAAPAHNLLTHRRQKRDPQLGRMLQVAFPAMPADEPWGALAEAAESALERAATTNGLRPVTD